MRTFSSCSRQTGQRSIQYGICTTRREARQLVNHGHFTLNGKKVDIPSQQVKAGDVIAVKAKSTDSPKFKEIREMTISTPEWVSIDTDKLTGKVLSEPTRDRSRYTYRRTPS